MSGTTAGSRVQTESPAEVGVLLMAYGAPETLDEVEPFLLDVRGGRPTPAELVAEVVGRYRAIGGGSPLLGVTRAQACALQARLRAHPELGGRFRVAVGMRHWQPRIGRAVAALVAEGCTRLVAIPLAPHVSRMSVGAYFDALDEALGGQEPSPFHEVHEVHKVEGFHDHPLFVQAWVERVRSGLERVAAGGWDLRETELLFTAHSLPRSIVADGDPYPEQLVETIREVTARIPRELVEMLAPAAGQPASWWRLSYQSAGARAVPWLGPSLGETLVELAAAGRRHVLVAPIGFVSDHVEVLYDLDVEAAGRAEMLGMTLERTESLNTAPLFVEALAELVRRALQGAV